MALIRWDPFRELNSLENQFTRIFGTNGRSWPAREPSDTTTWSPNVDILEADNELVLKAELPGLSPEAVELHLEKNVLTIKGERRFESEDNKDSYHRIERAYGSFSRSFSLPTTIDETKIQADFKDGLLTVTLPKQEQVKPRQIKIAS